MSQVQQKKVLKNHRFKNLNDKIIVFIWHKESPANAESSRHKWIQSVN